MKTTYATLCLVLLLAACGASQAPEESSAAAPADEGYEAAAGGGATSVEADAVSQLNDMCPENWCMGDYSYEFTAISCAGASCTLTFRAEAGGETHEGSVELDYDEPLIDEFGDLEAGYFERVTDMLDEWESSRAGAGS